jgi:PAS domain S-box-containing protein
MELNYGNKGDEAQQESERLFRALADAAPVMIWMSGTDKLCTYFNKRWLDFTGRSLDFELGNGWTRGIHPHDMQGCLEHYNHRFDRRQEFKMEYRLRRHDGEYRWVIDNGVPRYSTDGSFAGYVGSCFDITETKQAAEVISSVNARLIEAQEQERTRIARELHDDIGASLAILGVEMLRAGQPVSGTPGRVHAGIPELYEKMQGIARQVSRLSHKLHSPALEYMGMAKAIQIECREFSERFHIPVQCSSRDVPARLDQAIGLSFLRVVQEALHNAAKHSGATKVEVEVALASSVLTLVVRDNGNGFNVEQSQLAPGLGLISMRERMRLVSGDFEIRSQPGQGTEVICRAPLGEIPQAKS